MTLASPPLPATLRTIGLSERGRHAILLAPEPGRPRALAVELHGSGLDGRRQRSMSRLSDLLLPRDVAVLFPQGAMPFQLTPDVEPGFAWNIPGAPLPGMSQPAASPVDDLGWIEDVVRTAQSHLDLLGKPLFLVGYSGGARLASHLLVKGKSPWTAAGLVAGLRAVEDGDRAPPPTISFHGLDDPVNSYRGGDGIRWSIGVEEAGDRYATAQGCLPGFREERMAGGRRRVYSDARGKDLLTLHAVAEAAHAWPGSQDPGHLRAFGPAGAHWDASDLIATFLVRHLEADERPPNGVQLSAGHASG